MRILAECQLTEYKQVSESISSERFLLGRRAIVFCGSLAVVQSVIGVPISTNPTVAELSGRLASFAALACRLRRRVLRDIAMSLDELQQVISTQNTDDLLLMGNDNVMNLVVAHDSRRDAHVLILGHNVYFFRHDGADRRTGLEVVCEIGDGDDADRLTVTIDDGDRADAVPVQELTDMFDALMWLRSQYGFTHELGDLYVHDISSWFILYSMQNHAADVAP